MTEFLGWLGALTASSLAIPAAIELCQKPKETAENFYFLPQLMLFVNAIVWLTFGIAKNLPQVWAANGFCAIVSSGIMITVWVMRRQMARQETLTTTA